MSASEGAERLILVVDDYADGRRMFASFLSICGFRVAEASNGLEALEKANQLRPDLILMDLSLPVLDGWEATRRLKRDDRTRSIPVVALSAHSLSNELQRAKRAGCVAFVPKPCLPERLVAEIRRVLAPPPVPEGHA